MGIPEPIGRPHEPEKGMGTTTQESQQEQCLPESEKNRPTAPPTWLQFYRLTDWEHKVNLTRLLLYGVLGVCASGTLLPGPLALVLVFSTSLLMFAGAWSDYWDYKLEGQRNALAAMLSCGHLDPGHALFFVLAPLSAALISSLLLLRASAQPASGFLAISLIIFLTAYAAPPLRLKSRIPIGFLAAPLGASLMALIAWGATAVWRPAAGWLALLLFAFHCHAECLHVIDDDSVAGETRKLPPGVATAWGKWFPLGYAFLAGLIGVRSAVFFTGVIGGLIRYFAICRMLARPSTVHRTRTRLWSPIFCLPEFLVYGAAGLAHLF